MLISPSVLLPPALKPQLSDEARDEEMQISPLEQKIRGSFDGHNAILIRRLRLGAGLLIPAGRKLNSEPARQPAELDDRSVGTRPPPEGLKPCQVPNMATPSFNPEGFTVQVPT